MKKRIKLLQDYGEFKAGVIVEVDEKDVAYFTDGDTPIGELYEKSVQPTPPAPQKSAEEEEEERIAAAVAKALEEAEAKRKGNRPPIVQAIHETVDDDPKKGFKGLHDFCFAVKQAGTPGQVFDKRLNVVAEEKAPSGQSIQIDSDGGFLVPEAFSAQLLEKTFENGAFLSRALRIPMTTEILRINAVQETSRADGSRQGGVRVYRRAEAAQATSSKTKFSQVKLELHKLMGFAYDTDELLKWASPSVEPILGRMFANEFAFTIDNEILRGTGAGECLGIMNCPALVTVAKEGGQAADTIEFANIKKMWARMYAPSRKNAVWFVNQEVEAQLMELQVALGTAGALVFMPPGGISGQPYSTLFGRPIVVTEQCAALGDLGDIVLADMGEYLYGDEASGINYATSIHMRFDYGETAMRWTMYNDGQPWWASALTPYKGAAGATLSPFVTLAAR